MTMLKKSLIALSSALTLTICSQAYASYPEKPITFVVGFPPGTSTDAVARILGESMGRKLGQSIIVENKPGVGGSLGVAQVAKAKPDGYTLVLSATAPMNINPHVYKSLTYDPLKDLEPIGQSTWLPYVLVMNKTKNVNSFKELIDYAKAHPGELTYASIGKGTTSHLLMEMLSKTSGIEMVHVPYSGSTQSQSDVIGGNVDMTFDTVVSALPHVKAGRLNALAVSVNKRAELAPDIPTIEEQGIPNFNMGAWLGFFAPKGTSPEIIQKLHSTLNESLNDSETRKKLIALGSEVVSSESPQTFADMVKENYETWGNLVKTAGIEKQ
ncbi:Bug family tripartite tricarboxylate transporter substrate binding protein [Advenella alkanexedens]|uniref:Bug family tripartite tricarboxylate transporter substrate binding protein n=1 Tax=Advenella alkanexedens TaxID=1481665 RepID=UPI002676AE62|nr:tripartite tricarboxylate transporter substrate binding protein [Advenella alkanexedens]WKU19211.1 tripartite tricarboxylate transporter substrate binding protein [Advenella alkanexedens]